MFDGQTPATGEESATPGNPARQVGKPFTGVGSVMAAITREADLSQELVGAQAALSDAKAELQQLLLFLREVSLAINTLRFRHQDSIRWGVLRGDRVLPIPGDFAFD